MCTVRREEKYTATQYVPKIMEIQRIVYSSYTVIMQTELLTDHAEGNAVQIFT